MSQLLVYTRTTGYRHDSIEAGVAALRELGAGAGFGVHASESPGAFEGAELERYAAVVFLSTSGDVLTDAGRRALQRYVTGGGGFVGIHSALCTEYDWPFFGELLGAWFTDHPEPQPLTVRVVDPDHPATTGLPASWQRIDEAYNLSGSPRGRVRVLATLDEASYSGGTMGADHPVSWCHEVGAGRSFVTALGHPADGYADPLLRAHLLGGIRYAASLPATAPADRPQPASAPADRPQPAGHPHSVPDPHPA